MADIEFSADLLRQIAKLRKKIRDPSQLLKSMGKLGLASSQEAFQLQSLGDLTWMERYPPMPPPKINLAGALSDFNSGRIAPKPNRFQDRPALVDEGMRGGLWGSLSYRISPPNAVEWGTNKQYAALHQMGGVSRQIVTFGAKERIKDYLKKSKAKATRAKISMGLRPRKKGERAPRMGGIAAASAMVNYEAAKKLKPLLNMNTFIQSVIARPFVGVTARLEVDFKRMIRDYVERI